MSRWRSIRLTPPFSTPVVYSCIFHSCIFYPCNFDRIAFSTPAFSVAPILHQYQYHTVPYTKKMCNVNSKRTLETVLRRTDKFSVCFREHLASEFHEKRSRFPLQSFPHILKSLVVARERREAGVKINSSYSCSI